MTEWFCSGKIYTPKSVGGGHTQTGYFSTTAESANNTKASEVREDVFKSITEEFGVEESMIHIEQLYKV